MIPLQSQQFISHLSLRTITLSLVLYILMSLRAPCIFFSVGKLLSTVRLVSMPYLWYWYRIDPTDLRYEIQSMQ